MKTLICNKCNTEKELNSDNFYWRKDNNCWKKICKNCILKNAEKYYNENSDTIKETAALYRDLNRDVINEKATIYNNKPETKINSKLWRQKNRKKLRKKEKEWKLKNPDKAKKISRKKWKNRLKNPLNKIRIYVSSSIGHSLKTKGKSKNRISCWTYLSYTKEELKEYIEKQFEPWMNWNNWGKYIEKDWNDNDPTTWKWQLDHIIPHSEFPYTSMEDPLFKECWALKNLRPLSAKQNVLDGTNRTRHK